MLNARANRVAVKVNGDHFVADFYRTHKAIGSIHSENTEWVAPESATNKTSQRESFRQWVIEHAGEFGIDWKPEDMRTAGNIRKARYTNDQELIDDATNMMIAEMKSLVDKCKYPIEWNGVQYEDIIPMTHTSGGRDLSTMGIIDGKYEKSGNWAWAEIIFMTVFKYKKEECYIKTAMQLVSGQLKKTGMGITEFNAKVKEEIIDAGLAKAEELDPPKESKPKKSKENKVVEEQPKQEVTEEPKEEPAKTEEPAEEPPKKPRRRRANATKKSAEENK